MPLLKYLPIVPIRRLKFIFLMVEFILRSLSVNII